METISKLVRSGSEEGIFIIPNPEEWRMYSLAQKKFIVEGLRKAYDIYLRVRAQCPPQVNENNLASRLQGIDNDLNALAAADKEYLKELPELRKADEFFRQAFSAMGAEDNGNKPAIVIRQVKNLKVYRDGVEINEGRR